MKAPPAREREENDGDDPNIVCSADHDAHLVKKGSKSTLGYKGFARVDEEGFAERVHTLLANRGESPEFAVIIEGANARRIMADKAYASKANREMLIGKHRAKFKDGIMRKPTRKWPSPPSPPISSKQQTKSASIHQN